MPLHVTLRMAPHVYNLRSRRSFRVIEAALRIGGDRFHVRVIEFSVQGNRIHLLVEAPNRHAPARAIQGLSIRVAKGLNRMMGRSGRVFDDRYHARGRHLIDVAPTARIAVPCGVANRVVHVG